MTNAEKIAQIVDEIVERNFQYDAIAGLKRELPKHVMPKLLWDEAYKKMADVFMELFDAEMPGYIDRILQALGYEKPSEKEEG